MPENMTLLFVYNLDSGVLQSVHDYTTRRPDASGAAVHNLNTITHSPLGIKKEWKRFLKELRIPSRSMDRNEFITEFGHTTITFPVVLLKKGTELSVLLGAEELNRCRDLSDLIDLVNERILRI